MFYVYKEVRRFTNLYAMLGAVREHCATGRTVLHRDDARAQEIAFDDDDGTVTFTIALCHVRSFPQDNPARTPAQVAYQAKVQGIRTAEGRAEIARALSERRF